MSPNRHKVLAELAAIDWPAILARYEQGFRNRDDVRDVRLKEQVRQQLDHRLKALEDPKRFGPIGKMY